MCGIIGILKAKESKNTIEELVSSLKRMDYRGYDSWGYAIIDNSKIEVEKKAGRIKNATLKNETFIGVGHTRWATHGGVTDSNAHPHTDCREELAIVHNGIIENYLELKNQLEKNNHKFKSQTDTEVIAHLFESEKGNLFERAKKIVKKLKGAYALCVIDKKNPNEMVAIKNESPLIIGKGDDRLIVSSDPLAFIDYTKKAYFLDEGDIVHIKRNDSIEIKCYNFLEQKERSLELKEIDWESESANLNGFDHYMKKEIFEQPKTMKLSLDMVLAEKFASKLKGKKVVAVCCGTARHAAVIGKHLMHKIAKFPMEVMMAHEFSYFVKDSPKDTLILAVSQSGETADVLEVVRKAKKQNFPVISIVNVVSSTLARESDLIFPLNCGPEIAVASTKAFTNMVLAFYLIAFALNGENKLEEIKNMISLLEDLLPKFDQKSKEIAKYLKNHEHAYILGKGVNFPIALEGSLKLKEVSYIHSEGMPSGELKHGTLALIDKGTPVVILAPTDYTHSDSMSNALETKARGSYLIGISNKNHPSFDEFIELPELKNPIFYPILEIIPLQLIAYYSALELGRDIDKPRNLAKSVTVK